MNTALIVVDMQNDFMDSDGAPLPVGGATKLVDMINKTIRDLEKQTLVVFTQDWHGQNSKHFEKWPVHCVAGTWGAELVKGLYVPEQHYFVHKGAGVLDGYSAFDGLMSTDDADNDIPFRDWLSMQGIKNVYVCGVATDYCVLATALDSKRLGYNTFLITNCIAGVAPDTTDTALAEMSQSGVVPMQFHI